MCEIDIESVRLTRKLGLCSNTLATISKTPHLMIYTRYKANMRAS